MLYSSIYPLARLLVLVLALALVPAVGRAQAPAWQQALSGSNAAPIVGNSQARATAVNAAGDVFVAGSFAGQIAFGTTLLTSPAGGTDIFLAKWDIRAKRWAWATSGGSPNIGIERANAVAVSGNNVYIAGGTGSNSVIAGTTLSTTNAFLAKYTDNGNSFTDGWALSGGSTGFAEGNSIAVNGSSVYLTGDFVGTNGSFAGVTLPNTGSWDVFLAKYTDNGSTYTNGWAVSGGGSDLDIGYGVAVSGNSVYITGKFESASNATIAGTALPGAGMADGFLAKYTDNGSTYTNGWAVSGGGTSTDYGYAVAVSGNNVYTTGYIASNTGARVAGVALAGGGGDDIFLAKYVDNGTSVSGRWAITDGGPSLEYGNSLAVSGSSIYLAGNFLHLGTSTIAGTPLVAGAAGVGSFSDDLFVARYEDNGASVSGRWASSCGSRDSDYTTSLAVTGGRVYTAVGIGTLSYHSVVISSDFPVFSGNPALLAPGNSAVVGILDEGTGAWQQVAAPVQGGASTTTAATADATGNVFVTGYFTGQVAFGDTALVSAGGTDAFVAKWMPATSTWAWAARGGGTGDDQGLGIAAGGGRVYMSGAFASFSQAIFAGTVLPGAGGSDAFVASYADGGRRVRNGWAVSAGSSGTDQANGIAIGSNGVYVTGACASAGAVVAGTALGSRGGPDIFLAKYLDNGSTYTNGWAVSGGGSGNDSGHGVAVSGSSIYITGKFESGFGLAIAGTALTNAGGTDVFVAKYLDTGSAAANGWAVSGGGTGTDIGFGVAVRGNQVYATGTFASGRNARLAGTALTGAGGADSFLAKYSDNGSSAGNGWAVSDGGTGPDIGMAVAAAPGSSAVFLVGYFESASQARLAGTPMPGAGAADVFVAAYTDNGSTPANAWATSGGGSRADYGTGLALSGTSLYAVGSVSPAASFGALQLAGPVATNINFLARLVPGATGLATAAGRAAATLALYPNPATASVHLSGGPASAPVEMLDALGRCVARATTDGHGQLHFRLPAGLPAGVYVVRSGPQSQRLVVE